MTLGNGALFVLQTLVILALVLGCFRLGRIWLTAFVGMSAVLIGQQRADVPAALAELRSLVAL